MELSAIPDVSEYLDKLQHQHVLAIIMTDIELLALSIRENCARSARKHYQHEPDGIDSAIGRTT